MTDIATSIGTSIDTALPLTQGIYNQIQFLVVKYFTEENVWTRQIFGDAQYSYLKDDLASIQRPSLMCYPINAKKNSFNYSYTGDILMELKFSLKSYRDVLAQDVIQIAGIIELINVQRLITDYLQQYVGGLFWFGMNVVTDYSGVYQKESVVKMMFDFKVDLVGYQNWLTYNGYDLFSPDKRVYQIAQRLLTNLELLPNK